MKFFIPYVGLYDAYKFNPPLSMIAWMCGNLADNKQYAVSCYIRRASKRR
jgi:hypothetical protein